MVDELEADVAVETIGEVGVHSPFAASGYWRNQTVTEAAFQAGWLRTSDLARWHSDGSCGN